MIVKKVANPKKSSTKAARCTGLVDYILNPENKNSNEKCIYSGARGFISDDKQSQKAEMIALSEEAVRSRDPVNHYVLSWQEGEQPSSEQIEAAVSIFLDELGVKDHQVIYGLHADTDNIHLHIALNRVHPDSLKVIKPNKGFDKEAAHKAIARIEYVQGWRREQNGRYQVLENGELGREHTDSEKLIEPPQHIIDIENRTGEKSALRIAIEKGTPLIKQANSWKELHQALATVGMRYEKKGSGALIFVGAIGVKARDVYRPASLPKLQKIWGAYESLIASPPADNIDHESYRQPDRVIVDADTPLLVNNDTHSPIQPDSFQADAHTRLSQVKDHGIQHEIQPDAEIKRLPEPLKKDLPYWDTYSVEKQTYSAKKTAENTVQNKKHEQEKNRLLEQQKAERAAIFSGRWEGKGDLLNAMRSVLAAQQAGVKERLKENHKQEREQLRQKYRPYPTLEQWLRERQLPELADAWRYRASEPQHIEGGYYDNNEIKTCDIRNYSAEIHEGQVYYTLTGKEQPAFIDKGKIIAIYDWRNQGSLLAALQLSQQKWHDFNVTGNDEYKARCVKLAAEHGFRINNPELQEGIKQEKKRIRKQKEDATKPEKLKQFDAYNKAVNAERYRVTSIKLRKNGSQQTFILDKQDSTRQGLTPQEIEQRTPEMLRLQSRGESLYYTPLSTTKHHILIDVMDQQKLELLIKDGYTPAVVLELSPGRYQAIITVPKRGTSYDKEVGNLLAKYLNGDYGDPKLTGCIRPHSAPGYLNNLPEHLHEDGSYHEVKLLKADYCECAMTLDLSNEINAHYQALSIQKTPQEPQSSPTVAVSETDSAAAYRQHYHDVVKRQNGGDINLSRVDSMIAVRMRVTGHQQIEIESAIRQCAASIRTPEQMETQHHWDNYAQRTARYAFGAKADRDVKTLAKYRQQWLALESREIDIEYDMDDNDNESNCRSLGD